MKRIIGTKHIGKTLEMIKSAIHEGNRRIIFVTSNKDYVQGIIDGSDNCNKMISAISYAEFIKMIQNRDSDLNSGYIDIYIDNVDDFFHAIGESMKGYALTIDRFMMEV